DERGLSHRLRQYAVKPRTIRVGAGTARGYVRADLCDLWERYLPPPPDRSNTSNTSDTTPLNQPDPMSDVPDGTSFVSDSVSDGVSDRPQENDIRNNDVSDVSDVSDLSGHGDEYRTCAQCHAIDDGTLLKVGEVLLHAECRRFWKPPTDDLTIPE